MVISMKSIYKKVILTSFSVEPELRLQCFLVFGGRSAYKNSPPLPGAKNFATWLCVEYANWKAMVAYGNFCLKAGWVILSNSTTSHRGYIGTSQNRILWFKSTRRMPGEEVRGTPLKKWLERNVVWQSRYLIRAKVNIFMLHCVLVIRTFRTEGI